MITVLLMLIGFGLLIAGAFMTATELGLMVAGVVLVFLAVSAASAT